MVPRWRSSTSSTATPGSRIMATATAAAAAASAAAVITAAGYRRQTAGRLNGRGILIETPHHRGGGAPGIAIGGTSGVPSFPASQGNAAANADAADEKSCLPGLDTTAHSMP